MKSFVASLLQLGGVAAVAAGCWMLSPWIGATVTGVGLFATGVAIDPPRRKP